MGNLMTMGSCISEQQKRWNNNVKLAHRVADSYMSLAEQNGNDAHELGVTAQLLANFAEKHGSYDKAVRAFGRVNDSAADAFAQATHVSNFGPWIMDIFPLVTAWYPEFPLKDLISVQEMEKPLAWLFFSTLKTGTNKAPVSIGEVVETPLGMRQLKAKYVTGEIFGEEINGGTVDSGSVTGGQIIYLDNDGAETTTVANIKGANALLAYNPINLADDYKEKLKLDIKIGSTTTSYFFESESNGEIRFWYDNAGTKTLMNGDLTLDMNTGLIYFKTTSAIVSITANYVWNLDYAQVDNIPRIKEDVEKVEMVAKERAMMIEWTVFAEYLKKTQFGQDIQRDNLRRCLDLMYQYQVKYILDEMWTYAEGRVSESVDKGTPAAVVIPSNSTYSIDVKVQKVMETLNNYANIIEIESGRMAGNRLVVGRDFKAFLESLPNTYFKGEAEDSSAFSSPRKIGEIGGFQVYYNPFMENDKGFMTYRGKEFYDAAYYMGMYMPLTTTDTVVLGVNAKQSFVSMEAYKYHKKNCVLRLAFSFA